MDRKITPRKHKASKAVKAHKKLHPVVCAFCLLPVLCDASVHSSISISLVRIQRLFSEPVSSEWHSCHVFLCLLETVLRYLNHTEGGIERIMVNDTVLVNEKVECVKRRKEEWCVNCKTRNVCMASFVTATDSGRIECARGSEDKWGGECDRRKGRVK